MVLGSFSPDNINRLKERQTSVEQLQQLGSVWLGPDIAIEKAIVVQPGQFLLKGANIILNKKDLPAIDLTKGAFGSLEWSMRSFLAQCGIEINFHRDVLTENMFKDINEGKDVAVPIDIKNYGQRAVELEGNVMRFYFVNDANRLRGEEIVNTIKSGEFFIDGKEGEDWYIGGYDPEDKFATTEERSKEGLCVVVRLTPEKFNIPYSSEPIKRDESMKIRDQLSALLVKMPDGQRSNFEIGETPRIKLGPNVVAVINTGAEDGYKHIRSPFVDSGSDWSIRTETNGLDYVEFFLYKKS
jgi:hypothetical protein